MMDVSFDAFGGGNGWGEQGEQEFSAVSSTQRLNAFEKVPIPVSITDLVKMEQGEEKFHIGAYTFNTIKVIGVVASVQADQDQTCITYELGDAAQEGVKMAPSFTVIRYQGVESHPKNDTLREGAYVEAVGKLRSFNNRLSLISFHIHEVENVDEVELFQLEAKIAHLYYSKNIPERNATQAESVGVPFFACHAPTRGGAGVGGGAIGSQTPGRGGGASQQAPGTPGSAAAGARRLYQQEPANSRGLTGQQARIYEYIKQNSATASGVSVDEIRGSVLTDAKFSTDLNFLMGEGFIYNTVDDNHYNIIE